MGINIRFSDKLVSGYAHECVLISLVIEPTLFSWLLRPLLNMAVWWKFNMHFWKNADGSSSERVGMRHEFGFQF